MKLITRPSTPGAKCGEVTAASFCEVAIDIAAGFVSITKCGVLKQPFKGVDDSLLPELLTQVSVELRALSAGRLMQHPQHVQPSHTVKKVIENGQIVLRIVDRNRDAEGSAVGFYSSARLSPQDWAGWFGYTKNAKGSREFIRRVYDGSIRVERISEKRYRVAIDDLPAKHPEARNHAK